MTRSILLVPPPGSPLLVVGVAEAKPPVVRRDVCPRHGASSWVLGRASCPGCEQALPLLWRDEVCVEGCDRARRVLMAAEGAPAFAALSSIFDADDNAGPALSVWNADPEVTFHYEEKPIDSGGVVVVPALAGCPADLTGDARHAWALAVVAEARGLGRCVLVEEA